MKGQFISMMLPVWDVRIPFTRFRLSLDRIVIEKGQVDEVNKELTLMGMNRIPEGE